MNEHDKLIQELKGIRRVVINNCYGGFGLSEAAVVRYNELLGQQVWVERDRKMGSLNVYWIVPPDQRADYHVDTDKWLEMSQQERAAHNALLDQQTFSCRSITRDDPVLVRVVQELGAAADGKHAQLKVVEIPADVDWIIEEHDGNEWIAERHRTWQ